MGHHITKKGLDLPITGQPQQQITAAAGGTHVAIVAMDYVGMKPRMAVKVGDEVKRGQLLFVDRKAEGVRHTSPAAGRVTAVNRGDYRALQSVVVELSEAEQKNEARMEEQVELASFEGTPAASLTATQVRALLNESGLWTSLRARPHSRTPAIDADAPAAIFVNAMDTNPLAADPMVVLKGREEDFQAGVTALSKLTEGTVYVCRRQGTHIDAGSADNVAVEDFSGPHPSGTVGLHIHTLMPVSRTRSVWHLNYQQVLSIGVLVRTGRIDHSRVVALCGPMVQRPRLLKTRVGASLYDLTSGELGEGEARLISGSVLSGFHSSDPDVAFLGNHHNQVSVLEEGRERFLFGWLSPGADKFSTSGIYVSQLNPRKKYDMTTTTNGSLRAMVPIGMYERVFPFDILPTFLLRALLVDDIERAERLGLLELDEEDLALCTFVCPGKHDYAHVLRRNLDLIWKEG
jgi:Na+-transporting NADH:ubiquinone oxidoreductase subunit A